MVSLTERMESTRPQGKDPAAMAAPGRALARGLAEESTACRQLRTPVSEPGVAAFLAVVAMAELALRLPAAANQEHALLDAWRHAVMPHAIAR